MIVPEALREAAAERQKKRVIEISWARFDGLTVELARRAGEFVPQAVVGVAKGGVFVGAALASALKVEFYPIRISRRSRDSQQLEAPKSSSGMPPELKNQRVLIVDDVAASGETLRLARSLAKKAGAREVRTATLTVRPGGYRPDYHALETDALVVYPWDYNLVDT